MKERSGSQAIYPQGKCPNTSFGFLAFAIHVSTPAGGSLRMAPALPPRLVIPRDRTWTFTPEAMAPGQLLASLAACPVFGK